jgi:hypothetical protein
MLKTNNLRPTKRRKTQKNSDHTPHVLSQVKQRSYFPAVPRFQSFTQIREFAKIELSPQWALDVDAPPTTFPTFALDEVRDHFSFTSVSQQAAVH